MKDENINMEPREQTGQSYLCRPKIKSVDKKSRLLGAGFVNTIILRYINAPEPNLLPVA